MNAAQQLLFSQIVADQYNRQRLFFGKVNAEQVLQVLFPITAVQYSPRQFLKLKVSESEITTIAKAICEVMGVICPVVNEIGKE